MPDVLKDKVERLYEAYARFPKPGWIDSCDCCHTDAQKSILLNTKLRGLACSDLWDYTFSAFNTIGSQADFLYFAPRIIELAVTDDQYDVDLGQVGNKFFQSEYWEHGDAVQKALEDVILEHFQQVTLEDDSEFSEISDWMCFIGNAIPNIDPFLDSLFGSPIFKRFYDNEYFHAVKGKLSDAFWENNHGNLEKIVEWLLSDESQEQYWSFYNKSENSKDSFSSER